MNRSAFATDSSPASLCLSCRFVRTVQGRRGQQYLLCRNDSIPAKYPRQPVLDLPRLRARIGRRARTSPEEPADGGWESDADVRLSYIAAEKSRVTCPATTLMA